MSNRRHPVDPSLIRRVMAAEPDMRVLPCGCQIGDGPEHTFVIRPCSMSCPNYAFAIEEARRQSKPTGFGWSGNPC